MSPDDMSLIQMMRNVVAEIETLERAEMAYQRDSQAAYRELRDVAMELKHRLELA